MRMAGVLNIARRIAAAAALGLVAVIPAACSGAPPQPPAAIGRAVDRPLSEAVRTVDLVDQHGRHFTLGSLEGKTVFISPFLTLCADVCPFTTGNFAQVQASVNAANLGRASSVIEFSVDPRRDTVDRLAAYARANGVTWTLARSDAAGTAQMIKYFGYTAIPKPLTHSDVLDPLTGRPLAYDVVHSDGYAIVDTASTMRFVNVASPHFHGILPAKLRAFLSKEGLDSLRKPDPHGWRPAGALEALSWVTGQTIPLAPLR